MELDLETLEMKLRRQHNEAFSLARERAEKGMFKGKNDTDAWKAIRDHAVRANAILTIAYDLGVDLGNKRINQNLVRIWRIRTMKRELAR